MTPLLTLDGPGSVIFSDGATEPKPAVRDRDSAPISLADCGNKGERPEISVQTRPRSLQESGVKKQSECVSVTRQERRGFRRQGERGWGGGGVISCCIPL